MKPRDSISGARRGTARKHGEDDERDHLLYCLELSRRIDAVADVIGLHGEAIFQEGDSPANRDKQPERRRGYLSCPYQANVMNTLETQSSTIAVTKVQFIQRSSNAHGRFPKAN